MLRTTKTKVKVILSVMSLLVCVFIGIGIYAGDIFWLFKDYSVKFPESTMADESQSVTIDDYTISLKKSIYEAASGMGYLIFEVTSEKEAVETNMVNQFGVPISWGEAFGNDNRFSFVPELAGGYSYGVEGRMDGDKLIVYLKFEGVCDESSVPVIHLFDDKNRPAGKDYFEKSAYTFYCSTSTEQAFFEVSNGELYISEHGLRVVGEAGTDIETLVLYYEGGDSHKIIDNGTECSGIRICNVSESQLGIKEVIYEINIKLKVEQISHIELNGVKYQP